MTKLDAEALCRTLIEQMRAQVTADTALVGIHTGGVWLAERLHQALG
ncbi:MAG TPA: bifunctional pyr operon transcriptional regulator/uracil phosphoribosyltransferase PyrR, partial [Rhodocyclaceae bacterium]|nr:bifunctional pyr operon transcriptional regulator/uracil phosphoribosyltransferase PyrR [Rhodocyclaceae bacterium]